MGAYPAGVAMIVLGGAAYHVYDSQPRTDEYSFAVGAKDDVLAPYPCRLESSARADGQAWEVVTVEERGRNEPRLVITAVAPGTARFAYNHAWYVAPVRRPPQSRSGPPTVSAGERFQVALVGRDAKGNELEVGGYGGIVW